MLCHVPCTGSCSRTLIIRGDRSGRGVPGDRPSHQYGAVPSDDYEHGAYVDLVSMDSTARPCAFYPRPSPILGFCRQLTACLQLPARARTRCVCTPIDCILAVVCACSNPLCVRKDEGKESSWAVVLVRRCRRLCCNVLGLFAAVLAGAVLTLVFLSTTKDDIAFVALGDWGCGVTNCAVPPTAPIGYQNGGMNTRKVAAAMAAAATAISSKFVLALGDNFYFRGVKNVEDPLFKEVWEDQFSAPSLQVPWYVILGNHDHYGNPEAQIDFARQHEDCIKFGHCSADGKGRWTMPRYWYQQRVQSKTFTADFVFIDTVILCQGASEDLVREKQRLGALKPSDMRRWEAWAGQRRMMARLQLQWLEATLNASTADWLIVAGHYPVLYCSVASPGSRLRAHVPGCVMVYLPVCL